MLALPFLYLIAAVVAHGWGGEVVELVTYDERGNALRTSLWVADLHGEIWLRARDPESSWLLRLEANPDVVLVRDGSRTRYEAVVVEGFADRINGGMQEKYGLADWLLTPLYEPADVVAIRLDRP